MPNGPRIDSDSMVPILLGLQLGGYAVLQYNTIHPWRARRSTRENRIHLLSSTGCLFLGLFFLAPTWLLNFFVLFFFFFFFGGFNWGLHVLSRRTLRLFTLLSLSHTRLVSVWSEHKHHGASIFV